MTISSTSPPSSLLYLALRHTSSWSSLAYSDVQVSHFCLTGLPTQHDQTFSVRQAEPRVGSFSHCQHVQYPSNHCTPPRPTFIPASFPTTAYNIMRNGPSTPHTVDLQEITAAQLRRYREQYRDGAIDGESGPT